MKCRYITDGTMLPQKPPDKIHSSVLTIQEDHGH